MYKHLPGFRDLEKAYCQADCNTFGLYLGAGVNLSPPETKKTYKTYTWEGLLKELYENNKNSLKKSYEEIREHTTTNGQTDWAKLASNIVGQLKVPDFIEQLNDIIYTKIPRKDKYGRLSKVLLQQAPTLHSAIAFATEVNQKTKNSWTFKRNRKIGMVVTPNYDFFFGAGWTRYQAFKEQWAIQTPFSSNTGELQHDKGVISYIHGYIPYTSYMLLRKSDIKNISSLIRKLADPQNSVSKHLKEQFSTGFCTFLENYDDTKQLSKYRIDNLITELNKTIKVDYLNNAKCIKEISKKRPTQALLRKGDIYRRKIMPINRALLEKAFPHDILPYQKDIVLTSEQYRKYYAPNGFAIKKLKEALQNYNIIFLGTSFNDKILCEILKTNNIKQHYTIVLKDSPEAQLAKQLKICTIEIEKYSQVSCVLKEIYLSKIIDSPEEKGLSSGEEYWQRLLDGPVIRPIE